MREIEVDPGVTVGFGGLLAPQSPVPHAAGTMSLTSFVESPDVRERLKPLRPALPRKIPVPLLAPPRSKRYHLAGTALGETERWFFAHAEKEVLARAEEP